MRVLVARLDDATIGALTLLIHRGVMTYWYTGTLREFSAFRSSDLLVWSGHLFSGLERPAAALLSFALLLLPTLCMGATLPMLIGRASCRERV